MKKEHSEHHCPSLDPFKPSDLQNNTDGAHPEIIGLKRSHQEKTDATLWFMNRCVTLTSENEMPIVSPYTEDIPKDILAISRLTPSASSTIAPHFYLSDEKIRSFWNHPYRTEKRLAKFKVSISMDFSMTEEMSKPQKVYSCFLNKLWAAWLQSRGLKVIPNVSFPNEYWENYWLEGWPKHSIIAVSSVGIMLHGYPSIWIKGMERIVSELEPLHILRYGPKLDGEVWENCTYFNNDNNRAANGSKRFI